MRGGARDAPVNVFPGAPGGVADLLPILPLLDAGYVGRLVVPNQRDRRVAGLQTEILRLTGPRLRRCRRRGRRGTGAARRHRANPERVFRAVGQTPDGVGDRVLVASGDRRPLAGVLPVLVPQDIGICGVWRGPGQRHLPVPRSRHEARRRVDRHGHGGLHVARVAFLAGDGHGANLKLVRRAVREPADGVFRGSVVGVRNVGPAAPVAVGGRLLPKLPFADNGVVVRLAVPDELDQRVALLQPKPRRLVRLGRRGRLSGGENGRVVSERHRDMKVVVAQLIQQTSVPGRFQALENPIASVSVGASQMHLAASDVDEKVKARIVVLRSLEGMPLVAGYAIPARNGRGSRV